MNILSQLPSLGEKRKQRVGRGLGSGRGAKSGRGITRHQKSKVKIPLHFEGGQARLVKKYPLLRGKGKNKSVRARAAIIQLEVLNRFKDGEVVDLKLLIESGIVADNVRPGYVKILKGKGKLERKLTVKLPVSNSAQKDIEKAGGKIEAE